ncbi:MAG: DUF6090 family protein [Eudoraea sp.]
MINFFRKIRKKLLVENKTWKYLKYAIGEIILVVIGILIALQVNNWNENRKVENYKLELLIQLKEDINNDIHYLKELDSVYGRWQIQAVNIIKALEDKSINRITTIDEYIIGRGSMNQISIITKTFDQMKDSGILNKITNKKLSQSIDDYYEFAKIEIQKTNIDNQEFYSYVLNISGYEYIHIGHRIIFQTDLDYIDWSWLKDPTSERYKKFESRISFHWVAINANRELLGNLLEKAENILKVIDS